MALDPEMIAVLDKYFREMRKVVKEEVQGLREEFQAFREETAQQFQAVREETAQQFQVVREEVRHLGVRIEGLESTIQTVAEGVVGNNERLDAFRGEVAREFKEVRETMQLHYRDLDRRVSRLEQRDAAKKVVKRVAKKASGKKASRGN